MSENFHPKIEVKIIAEEGVELPHYASMAASGADIKAFIKENIVIPPNGLRLIPTGIRFAIPAGYEIQVRPRSGLALKHQIGVLNTPGTIDADYRGEVLVILMNFGTHEFIVEPNMRIAQIVLAPVLQANFILSDELAQTVRSSGGFGHTGL